MDKLSRWIRPVLFEVEAEYRTELRRRVKDEVAADGNEWSASYVFDEASKALLNQIETIIKLIRSKGVVIFFCSQQPTDIPETVLSQLGLKIQHSLRAFTARDRKTIKTGQPLPCLQADPFPAIGRGI